MRIPLDYYKILGIPIQVTEELLNQAYCDRSLQLPRREYSAVAISARKLLLKKAYEVLSDPQTRSQYEVPFLQTADSSEAQAQSESESSLNETDESKTTVPERYIPSIEIPSDQLIAALLVLQELGEYEQILQLGCPYLHNPQAVSPDNNPETLQSVKSDLALAVALAYWELGREQWQRGEYETAAASGNKGVELLEQENLFPFVRQEIRAELYKLRPYRILELLSLNDVQVASRRKGLQLLREMLQDRRGIDGKGDDRSGLTVDRCLLFIQQIRIYLSAAEQQELFEAEAQRPSAVGKYLAVYALIARGFAEKQPALIVRASELLTQLSDRQDVRLEQAMCALLLGQTEAASQALEGSKQEEALAFIRTQSQGEPDLLRGLCVYGERWLQTEVFSRFRDLANQNASIKEYFADRDVQEYLEQLPIEVQSQERSLETENQLTLGEPMAKDRARRRSNLQERRTANSYESVSNSSSSYSEPKSLTGSPGGRTATLLAPKRSSAEKDTVNLRGYAEDPPELSREQLVVTGYRKPSLEPPRRRRRSNSPKNYQQPSPQHQNPRPGRRKNRPQLSAKRRRAIGIVAVLGAATLSLLFHQWNEQNKSPESALQGDQLEISLAQPPLDIPPVGAQEIPPSAAVLTQQEAEQVIQTWLTVKSQALGEQHQIDKLDSILTGSLLSQWRDRAATLKNSNEHRSYQHEMQVSSLKTDTQNPNVATVDVSVREITSYYHNKQLDSRRSDDDKFVIRYELVRQREQWLIKNSKVISNQ